MAEFLSKFNLIGWLVCAVFVTILVANAIRVMNEVREEGGERVKWNKWTDKLSYFSGAWVYALIVGASFFLITFAISKTAAAGIVWVQLIWFALSLILLAFVDYIWWFKHEGAHEGAQMAGLIIAEILIFVVPVMVATSKLTAMIPNPTWASVVRSLAPMALVAAIGYILIDACYYRSRVIYAPDESDDEDKVAEKEELSRKFLYGGRILIGIVTAILIFMFFANFNWPARSSSEASDESADQVEASPWMFHHYEVYEDKDASNDFDFGVFRGDLEKMTAEEVAKEHQDAGLVNPAIGVPAMINTDIRIHTDFTESGTYLDDTKPDGEMTEWMNKKIAYYVENPEAYAQAYGNWVEFISRYATVKVAHGYKLKDQMYQMTNEFPIDVTKVPEVVVLETDQPEGDVLIYYVTIKGNVFEIPFRVNCYFQPTNVAELLEVTPGKNPNNPEGEDPLPTDPPTDPPVDPPTDPPVDPPVDPPTDPPYNKNPDDAKAPNMENNDNQGPGGDTNAGKGEKHSTKDQGTNSDHYDSYDEYKENVEELGDINETQREAGDSNRPSTPPSSGANVDNNGGNGTGHGGADTATPTQEPAHEAGSGQEISDNPGDAWGGPSD